MTILLTGAHGFVGKHVQNIFKTNNIQYLAPTSKELDLTNFSSTMDYFDRHRPTTVCHLAAKCAGILGNLNSPADFVHINLKMASNIFDAVYKYNTEYVYPFLTTCMYPKFCPVPFKEDDIWNGRPEESNLPYSESKRALLLLFQTYRKQYGLKGLALLPCNVFGEYDNFDPVTSHVIPALIKKFTDAKKNNSPVVECWGTGKGAYREFIYAQDLARALLIAIQNKKDYPEPVNIGTGKTISIYDLAHLIAELTGFNGDIVFTGAVSDGQPQRQLDVSRAKEVLGFEAQTDLRYGLISTINWYKKSYG